MCIIMDANCLGKFNNTIDEDMEPIRNWLERKNGRIAYSNTEEFKREWESGGGYELRRELERRGKLKSVPAQDVLVKQNELTGLIESNDAHIIALAILAEAKVLVVQRLPDTPTKGKRRILRGADPDLQQDFKNLVGGNIYLSKGHSHLLTKDLCPD